MHGGLTWVHLLCVTLIAMGRVNIEHLIGGLACYNCWFARKKSGNSNSTRWMTKSYYDLKRIEDRRDRQVITTTDYKDIKSLLHVPKNRFTAKGLVLHNENYSMHACAKKILDLTED